MAERLSCWKCGTVLSLTSVTRRDECPGCRAELHVCRMCRFFDPNVSQACREPIAEPVLHKERANFCGYFEVSANAYRAASDGQRARQQLESLFGAEAGRAATDSEDSARAALDELFGNKGPKS